MNQRLILFTGIIFILACTMIPVCAAGDAATGYPEENAGNLNLPAGSLLLPGTQDADDQIPLSALPLSFIPNAGQADPAVRFMVRGSGSSFAFTDDSILFAVKQQNRTANESIVTVTQKFVGADHPARVEGEDPLPGTANFFLGGDQENWYTDIPTYGSIRYHDIYPGIDLVYRGNGSVLKREFIVEPHADPSRIRMEYAGADFISLAPSGALIITAGRGTMTETRPVCYQEIGGRQVFVNARFVLTGQNGLTIETDTYDPAYPLVIDPDLVYSTYLGGAGSDYGYAVAVDTAGNLYVTGETTGSFPTTVGAFNTSGFGGDSDAFIAKFGSGGSSLVYSTYLGGYMDDYGRDIAVDSAGNAYVTGTTYGPIADSYGVLIFPLTPNSIRPYENVWEDAFVTKLSPAGNYLVYSGRIGGWDTDYGEAIAIDSEGKAYVAGRTDGPLNMTVDSSRSVPAGYGNMDGFVMVVNPSGTDWVCYNYTGGTGMNDGVNDIALDSENNMYMTGTVYGGLVTTPGAFQTTPGGSYDAFVTRMNSSCWINYTTYLGGSGSDEGQGIAVDTDRNAYVTGKTRGTFPTTEGAFQTVRGVGDDVFVTKLNPSGSALIYSTYIGGSQNDRGYHMVLDPDRNAYITGITLGNFPNTTGAFQTTYGGGTGDAFVAKLNPSGSNLLYSTYLGGDGTDQGNGIARDSAGSLYITGYTSSNGTFPTVNPLSGAFGGKTDVFIAKLKIPASVAKPIPEFTASPRAGTAPLTVRFTDASTNSPTAWKWTFGDGSQVNSTQKNPVHTYTAAGTYTVTLRATNSAGSNTTTKTSFITITAAVPPTVTGITPPAGKRGAYVTVTNLSGTGFRAGAKVFLNKSGSAIAATNVSVVSGKRIACTFRIPPGAMIGPWNVTVRNTDGKYGTKANAFTVKTVTPPTVTGITPAAGKRGTLSKITNLSGTGFITTPKPMVQFVKAGKIVTATNVTVASTKKISCTVKFPATAATGPWNVRVTNADGQVGAKAGAFTVTG